MAKPRCTVRAVLLIVAALVAILGQAPATHAALSTMCCDQATFLGQLSSFQTLDFEESSGFPASPGLIASNSGILFNARTFSTPLATSGTQAMTAPGVGDPVGVATIDFTGLPTKPNAFGFFVLDLVNTPFFLEAIEISVKFTSGAVFTMATHPGDFDVIHLGFFDTQETFDGIALRGIDTLGREHTWEIDDLTIGQLGITPVGLPPTLALLGCGILTLFAFAARRYVDAA